MERQGVGDSIHLQSCWSAPDFALWCLMRVAHGLHRGGRTDHQHDDLDLSGRMERHCVGAHTSPSGLAGAFSAVSCPTTGACTATGMYQVVNGTFVTLAEQWNGATWTIESTPSPSNRKLADLTGVSCVSASTCEAVGFSATSLGHDYTLAVGNA